MTTASKRQTWAVFCATGLDVRDLNLSRIDASNLLDAIKYGENVVPKLQAMGATGKPKGPKVDYSAIFTEACLAGKRAGENCKPSPMVVQQHENMLDDNSPVSQQWTVQDGVCGFAWVKVGGNTGFGRWLMKSGNGSKGYPSGVVYWVAMFGQSMQRKEAFAHAFAQVLKENGIKAYAESRMD